MAELSPMMQQYLEIKKQHKDEILFYRIGDFYEMFFDDALTASKELDLTLTGKQCGMEERAPMCGVPFHSYEGYVARLIAKGYKVAICEQVEDPAKAKGLVKRDIIRVVTPGTVIESSMLQDDRNNYIASIFLKGKKAGLCFADVSTGTAHITELNADKIGPGGHHGAVPLPSQRSADESGSAGLPRGDGVHQKEYDLFGGADRRGALCTGPCGGIAGKPVWPRLGADHRHCSGRPCALCHGGAAGISARYPDQGRGTSENGHQPTTRPSSCVFRP